MLQWDEAGHECEQLQWGEFGDWRLPSPRELDSIIDTRFRSPPVDSSIFPGTSVGVYWTSHLYGNDPRFAWFSIFSSGRLANAEREVYAYVRCVRGGP